MSQAEIVETLRGFLKDSDVDTLEHALNEHEAYNRHFLNRHAENCLTPVCTTCFARELSDYDTESVQDAWYSLIH